MGKKIKIYKTIDLFAGMGGIRIGFDKAGFKTVYANDVEPSCKLTYDANFNNINLDLKDLRKVSTSNLPNLLDFSAIKSV